ncbi:hypothetical protein [Diaminobutyricimonas sp. TR449]|uniref:hypothetical protein n=1 Tax=Diaminobutyricimonas sp. TR449 TaxID=2708076 RepID=UPI0014202DE9|nr:hypothetical protein [Diaminobutyricimonas sp. TR449]
MNNEADDDKPLEPAAMLALLEQQKRAVDLAYLRPVGWLYTVWGVAWVVGFLLLWLAATTEWMQESVARIIFGALIIASIAVSAVVGIRIGRGIRGASDFQGAVYGMSWTLLGIAFAALGAGLLQNGMSSDLAALYFPSAYALMAGALYLSGAALWNERSQLVLGIVLLAVGAIAPFFGGPANNLVMAIGGGGAFLLAAASYLDRIVRERRR